MTGGTEDESIDRVLAGLRAVQPPSGMEARVLAGMAAEQADAAFDGKKGPGAGWNVVRSPSVRAWSDLAWVVRGATRNGGAFGGWAVLGRVVAVSVMVAVVMMGGVVRFRRLVAVQDVRSVGKATGRTASPLSAVVIAEVPVRGAGTVHGRNRRVPMTERRTMVDVVVQQQKPGDTAEVSFPAPPMPLTRQEVLLVAVARAQDPVQVALLDTQARAAQDTDEKARFENFFQSPARERPVLVMEIHALQEAPDRQLHEKPY